MDKEFMELLLSAESRPPWESPKEWRIEVNAVDVEGTRLINESEEKTWRGYEEKLFIEIPLLRGVAEADAYKAGLAIARARVRNGHTDMAAVGLYETDNGVYAVRVYDKRRIRCK